MFRDKNAHLLKFAGYHDPILRQAIEPVQFPLTKEDKQIIQDMKFSIKKKQLKKAHAPWDSASGMAANQWGIKKRIFLYCPYGEDTQVEVIINPSYEPLSEMSLFLPLLEDNLESCFSVPLAVGHIRRYTHIKATYQNEKGEIFTQELSDLPARVWQHETDHLNGLLYDDPSTGRCLFKKEFTTRKQVDDFYLDFRKEKG